MSDFFERYLNNQASEEDFNSFLDLFLKSGGEEELKQRMYLDWKNRSDLNTNTDLAPVLCNVHSQINKTDKLQKSRSPKETVLKNLYRIAAILILPLALTLFYEWYSNSSETNFTQTVSTPLASRTSFILPDGSTVWLNAGSSISFPNKFSKESREVKLIGQAYFDVKKDKIPFKVKAENFSVRVLGTAFDVQAYPQENASVTLERGKVQIETNSNGKTDLVPGQQATIDKTDGQIDKRNIDPKAFVSWKDNRLTFEEEPLDKVVLCLERWFNVKISIEDSSIQGLKVNGTIEYENITEVLNLLEITAPIHYTYDKENQIFRIKSRK